MRYMSKSTDRPHPTDFSTDDTRAEITRRYREAEARLLVWLGLDVEPAHSSVTHAQAVIAVRTHPLFRGYLFFDEDEYSAPIENVARELLHRLERLGFVRYYEASPTDPMKPEWWLIRAEVHGVAERIDRLIALDTVAEAIPGYRTLDEAREIMLGRRS
jgi:hypothetical protein